MRTLATIAFMYLAVALPANNALAQQRLVFKVDAEDTKYTQQHTVDVGDVSGHQVRILRWEPYAGKPRFAAPIPAMHPLSTGLRSWNRGPVASPTTPTIMERGPSTVYMYSKMATNSLHEAPCLRCKLLMRVVSPP